MSKKQRKMKEDWKIINKIFSAPARYACDVRIDQAVAKLVKLVDLRKEVDLGTGSLTEERPAENREVCQFDSDSVQIER